jgi:nitroreductase
MEVQRAIEARYSLRSYLARPVPDDVLGRILEAGRISPSAVNHQPWHFIVVRDPTRRKVLAEGPYAKFLVDSPVVIVGLADKAKSPKWHVVDTTIALQTMVLAATSEGLGTCWIGSFSDEAVRSLLKIPDKYAIVAMLTVGYPKEEDDVVTKPPKVKNRKPLSAITSFEEFGRPKQ